MEYPELAARTRRFSYGAPRALAVSADGSRVAFLRSGGPEDPTDRLYLFDVPSSTERLVADPASLLAGAEDLPPEERALRERLRLSASGIGSYAMDPAGTVAAFTLAGRLFRADLATGALTEVPTSGPVIDPRPDPTGARIAYVTGGALRVTDPDALIAGEEGITWGLADFIAAEEFQRYRGYWWAPDGRSILAARVDETRVPQWTLHDPAAPEQPPRAVAYPHAGAANAEVTLHLLDLDGGWVDVHWDRETYPYLVSVSWSELGGPLITVLRRLQQHGLVLAIDPRTGETQVHAELADPRWVDPIPGTPAYLSDGRVLVGGELAHDGYDARCLFADGSLLTPPSLYVHRVVTRLRDGGDRRPVSRPRGRAMDGAPGRRPDRPADKPRDRPAIPAAAGSATGHRPATADRRAVPAPARGRPQATGARRHLRRPRPPGGGRGALALAGKAVVGRRRVRRRGRGQPGHPGRIPELREGHPPPDGRRRARRPGRRAARAR
jgi:dipeptidyl-peptidase-4